MELYHWFKYLQVIFYSLSFIRLFLKLNMARARLEKLQWTVSCWSQTYVQMAFYPWMVECYCYLLYLYIWLLCQFSVFWQYIIDPLPHFRNTNWKLWCSNRLIIVRCLSLYDILIFALNIVPLYLLIHFWVYKTWMHQFSPPHPSTCDVSTWLGEPLYVTFLELQKKKKKQHREMFNYLIFMALLGNYNITDRLLRNWLSQIFHNQVCIFKSFVIIISK